MGLDNQSILGWGCCIQGGGEAAMPQLGSLLELWRPGQGHFNLTSFCEVRGALLGGGSTQASCHLFWYSVTL